MSWVTPKTWWNRLNGDHINYTDVNRIKNNVQYIYDHLSGTGVTSIFYTDPPTRSITFTITEENKDYFYRVTVSIKGQTSGKTYRNIYYFHGAGTYEYGQDCMYLRQERCKVTQTAIPYIVPYFTIKMMFRDKSVNDLWYADEINTVLDNLETIAEHTSNLTFNGRPYYGDNSPVPTDIELNIIEGFTLNLYNRIYRDVPGINLGIDGSIGERITNRLL